MKIGHKDNNAARFLRSAMTLDGDFCSCDQALDWINDRKKEVGVKIEVTQLSNLKHWKHNSSTGRIEHETGKFFSIEGIDIRIETTDGELKKWSQPIINQPEVGYLGCIVKEFNGLLYFLVQAKIEPGNVNVVQISPTLQATRSNYTQVHKGRAPKFLDYFNVPGNSKVLVDQLQSEQGARFLSKRNRNIIVEVDGELELPSEFKWLTLGQIKVLIGHDNVVNMDLRTVVSCIPINESNHIILGNSNALRSASLSRGASMLSSALNPDDGIESIVGIMSWLTELKSKTDLHVNKVGLNDLEEWAFSNDRIRHIDNKYFDILWVSVEIMHREVARWDQPIIAPFGVGVIAFIVKKISGVYHFLVQAEIECGNFDLYEFGPTVACVEKNHPAGSVRFLEYILSARNDQIVYSALQSEEGGRFYHEQNRNIIVEADESFSEVVPSNYKWMTLNQLLFFVKFNNLVNIGARSLLSGIRFE
jgi:dTDP-4-dehydro-6-deoxy-alpha-D-glucopyranose 2,3-dehydratase